MAANVSLTYVALLRGINVGGKNKLPMKELVAMFGSAGCHGAQAYIQSGNIIFCPPPGSASGLPDAISAQIAKQFGYKIPVVLRTAEQMSKVLRNNPFLQSGAAETDLHVMFLADVPDPQRVEDLDPNRWLPDEFIVRGQEIYLRLPNGVGRSKLTNQYFDLKLATVSTGRNWRTVTKLVELMSAFGSR